MRFLSTCCDLVSTIQGYVVESVTLNSEVYRAGLRVNDRILKINGTSTKEMNDKRWQRQFRTSPTVTLQVQRMTTTSTDSYNSMVCEVTLTVCKTTTTEMSCALEVFF